MQTTRFFFSRKNLLLLLLLAATGPAWAQGLLTGRVSTPDGEPLPGATIQLTGTVRGTTAGPDGRYRLPQLPGGTYRVRISYIGFAALEQAVEVRGETTLNATLARSTFTADEVVVSATRAGRQSGMAYSHVSAQTLEKQNLGQDLPVLLNFQPSVVTTSDAGAGVGYTGLRVRGTDATRINVTLNGIPYNDPESQGTFWVNMPDFASSVSDIQLQRGVGTSTNGAGAFGATVNINTNAYRPEAYAETNLSYGSFNTQKQNVLVGTGLLRNRFTLDARLSRIKSDGYIDRAWSDLKSFYVSGAYFGKKSYVRFNAFSGMEKTYQAWGGVPEALLKTNRTFNPYTYENETDNYQQDHYQLLSSHQLSRYVTLNVNGFYVKGRGYYEQFRENDRLSRYGIANVVIGDTTVRRSDLIRRRWLDNDFYGTTFSLDYDAYKKLKTTLGGGYNYYDGRHFGEVIWARFAGNSHIRQRYYENQGLKSDANVFAKAFYAFSGKLTGFGDVQLRRVGYRISGPDNDGIDQRHRADYTFFNPKAGLTYTPSERASAYASVSVGSREPNRNDFTDAPQGTTPLPEYLTDYEAGYRWQSRRFAYSLGGYLMNYRNQLILTGRLNDVGSPIRQNVPQSYRLGLEAEAAGQLTPALTLNLNLTLSRNKIRNYEDALPVYDADFNFLRYETTRFRSTDISFSPGVVAGSQLAWRPVAALELAWLGKYVGRQFMDNTASTARSLDPYLTNDLRARLNLPVRWARELTLTLLANNVLGERYESNGYTYSYKAGDTLTTENFYYPQAGFHWLSSLTLKF